ncbi:unnamed protein product [Rotaria socialis]
MCSNLSKFQKKTSRAAFNEWNNTANKRKVINKWLQNENQPITQTTPLSILHYNIRYFYSNQSELLDIISRFNPMIISLNELGTYVSEKAIKQHLFSYNIFTSRGTNSHGGVVLAIDKKFNVIQLDINELNIIAVQLIYNNQTYLIVSTYSPPQEPLPLQIMSFFIKNFKHIIIVGDLNAKHENWGCTSTNQKGRDLANWLDSTNMLEIQNQGMKTSLRSNTTIDLILTTSNLSISQCQTLPYNCSDHLPILFSLNEVLVHNGTFSIAKTYWEIYKILLVTFQPYIQQEYESNFSNNPTGWFQLFQKFLVAVKRRATNLHTAKQQRPTITPSIRAMIKHKHYLQNKYRHSKSEEDRVRLRSWSKLVQHELKSLTQTKWLKFINQVASPNPKKFWQSVKCLNKNKSCTFSAINEDNQIYKTSEEILNILYNQFSKRFTAPTLNPNNTLDTLTTALWSKLSNADQNDIELVCINSDLNFNINDLRSIIKTLKSTNSSSFDEITNNIVKNIPESYYSIIISAYNSLFRNASWDVSWKQARTICLNKVTDPAPTTNQLRPISLLPTFSKLYEKLFLLKFNKWLQSNNILPNQQSGSRSHLGTLTRVNHIIEQLNQSLNHNTFAVVVYVDFLQAFDRLWHQGLVAKLHNLHCPLAYLFWIINYFKDRTITIDYQGSLSKQVCVSRGAPQGSCFGPVAYIVNHYDLPMIFNNPQDIHLYVDDLAIIYSPSIYLKFSKQVIEIQSRINYDLLKLEEYAEANKQPININKTNFVIYHRTVQVPKIQLTYQNQPIVRQNSFKYLGFHIDSKLSFNIMINNQLVKLRKSYSILKYIHCAFPTFFELKMKFFQTYTWPHLYMLASIYCLFSNTSKNRINSFYRRCQRLIYCSYRISNDTLHDTLKIPTLTDKFQRCLQKRLKNIQSHEEELLNCYLLYKKVINDLSVHYKIKPFIPSLPIGRPNKRIIKLTEMDNTTYFDKLCNFTWAA